MSEVETEPWNRTDWTDQSIKAWNAQVIAEFRANGGQVGGPYAGGDLLLLTTTGARTGRCHTVPLSYLDDGERLIVSLSMTLTLAGMSPSRCSVRDGVTVTEHQPSICVVGFILVLRILRRPEAPCYNGGITRTDSLLLGPTGTTRCIKR